MKNNGELPQFLFPGSTSTERARQKKLKEAGLIQRVGPRLYSSLPRGEWAKAVPTIWAEIVARLYPEALISFRTAMEFRPSPVGKVYLTANTDREVEYPGLTLKFIRGHSPLQSDSRFLGAHVSSQARAFLENLSSMYQTNAESKIIDAGEIEKRLEAILHIKGEGELNKLRDQAKKIAKQLKFEKQYKKLDSLVGGLLGTKTLPDASGSQAQYRAQAKPFDPSFVERFQVLSSHLLSNPLPDLSDEFSVNPEHQKNRAFFEAYFSNYIEGTQFEIAEAEEIIFDRQLPERRPEDAHDIIGTYEIIRGSSAQKNTYTDLQSFKNQMVKWHKILMAEGSKVNPGEWKTKVNRAGSTHFVHPEYLMGTMEKGFNYYREVPQGLARAVFVMFLITEIHPFNDGNGRLARLFMNAELQNLNLSRILIPTVYREDYLSGLRAMSKRNRPEPLIKMLRKAQQFSSFDFSNYPKALTKITGNNWFLEPNEGKIIY